MHALLSLHALAMAHLDVLTAFAVGFELGQLLEFFRERRR